MLLSTARYVSPKFYELDAKTGVMSRRSPKPLAEIKSGRQRKKARKMLRQIVSAKRAADVAKQNV